jgi:uncharacterized protein (DUF4415 family)
MWMRLFCSLFMFTGSLSMTKKLSESSQQEKLVSVSADYILNRRLTSKEKAALRRLRNMPDSEIDYSDIPPLTEEQIATARRPARKMTGARLDADVMEWLQSFGPGYSSRINNILRAVMERSR